MNWLDWLALSMGLVALVGGSLEGPDFEQELNRPTAAQVAQAQQASAGVTVGGAVLMRFTDSGVAAAEDRAREARLNLRRAVDHFGLPQGYLAPGLRVTGGGDLAELHYLDVRLAIATATDAKANGLGSARALAERWQADLDRAIRALPQPMPDGWIATAGAIKGTVLVSDETLARAAAACLDARPGQRVRVSAAGGVLMLEGEVATARDKARLARLMRELPGVRGVDDRVGVTR